MAPWKWCWCTCGKSIKYKNEESKRTALARCVAEHVHADGLYLDAVPATVRNSTFHILSHTTCKHLGRTLREHLEALGVPAKNIQVHYGLVCGRDKINGRPIRANEVCQYSFLHKWIPRVSKDLLERHRRGQQTAAVWYLECDCDWADLQARDFVGMANAVPDGVGAAWPGHRRIWTGGPYALSYGSKFQIEGSHAICFKGGGLAEAWECIRSTPGYGHLDVLLARGLKRLHLPEQPCIGTRGHYSIIYGKGVAKWRPAFRCTYDADTFKRGRLKRSLVRAGLKKVQGQGEMHVTKWGV